ncbi:TetR/AcrR family transcriptional regulator [Paeniglutamicibacter psychrophenolicus]|uniref:DNA-binding transcriptional regulator YbjK n=1 Tax=Paeniglutamicibacter psychrophenolicus TaxID=257454 RepID=A0ABS4WBZ0_9MICC|nr:TetR/AcrR family transcriptional regulator [Paeniglutamicibacter psychrophenolicus]MBP2373709.1 DNA-binding transcriptional regulator YbjK [Paeniglutamicibacter psychrophenolicus]
MPPTKARALQAALELLGTGGIRALTHARVDAQAGLPRGSASNYFRTRSALLVGAVEELGAREAAEVAAALPPDSAQGLLEVLCAQFRAATTAGQGLTAARFALFVEGIGHPEVRDAVSRGRAGFERMIVPLLGRLGAAEPEVAAMALMSAYEGMLLYHLARGLGPDPEPVLELVLRAAVPAPASPPQ